MAGLLVVKSGRQYEFTGHPPVEWEGTSQQQSAATEEGTHLDRYAVSHGSMKVRQRPFSAVHLESV